MWKLGSKSSNNEVLNQATEEIRRRLAEHMIQLANQPTETPTTEPEQTPTTPSTEIEKLGQLLTYSKLLAESPHHSPWPTIILFLVTAVVVGFLLLWRVSTTAIILELRLSAVEFRLAGDQNLTEPLPIRALSISGIGAIEAPKAQAENHRKPEVDISGTQFEELTMTVGKSDGVITFSDLWVADGTLLNIERFRQGSGLAMAIQTDKKPPVASVVVPKRVRLGMPGGFKGAVDFGRAREMVITAEETLEIQMQPVSDTSRLFRPEIPIRALSVIDRPQQEGASFRPFSTLRQGVLYLEDLNARKHRLRRGEHLRLEMTTGMLRVLEIGPSDIRLELSARVKTLALGSQNLMPRCLEYLKAQSEWMLFFGTTIFLFGFVLDLLRWLGAWG